MSTGVHDIEPVAWTSYTDQCCKSLQDMAEIATDNELVRLVRTCQLADQISRTFNPCDVVPGPLSAPLCLSIRWYQSRISEMESSLPLGVRPSSKWMWCRLTRDAVLTRAASLQFLSRHAQVLLYRISLLDEVTASLDGPHALTKLDLLNSSMESVRSFVEAFSTIPPGSLPYLSHPFWIQFAHALMILSRLSFHRPSGGGWDPEYVRSVVNYDDVIDALGRKFVEARLVLRQRIQGGVDNGEVELPQIFESMEVRLQGLKDYFAQMRASEDVPALSFDFMMDPSFLASMGYEDDIFGLSSS